MGKYFDVSYMIQAFPQLLNYVHVTVLITVISAILGVILGSIIAIIRLKKVPVLNQLFIVFYLLYAGHAVLSTTLPHLLWGARNHVHMGLNMKTCRASYSCMPCLHCILRRIVLKSCAPV